MNDSKLTSEYCAGRRSERGLGMLKIGFLLGLLSIAANGALAQSAEPTADESLTTITSSPAVQRLFRKTAITR